MSVSFYSFYFSTWQIDVRIKFIKECKTLTFNNFFYDNKMETHLCHSVYRAMLQCARLFCSMTIFTVFATQSLNVIAHSRLCLFRIVMIRQSSIFFSPYKINTKYINLKKIWLKYESWTVLETHVKHLE